MLSGGGEGQCAVAKGCFCCCDVCDETWSGSNQSGKSNHTAHASSGKHVGDLRDICWLTIIKLVKWRYIVLCKTLRQLKKISCGY